MLELVATGIPPPTLNIGVTVIVEVIAEFVVFVAVNAFIFPKPLAANPIVVSVLVQLNTVPETVPVKLTDEVLEPAQIS